MFDNIGQLAGMVEKKLRNTPLTHYFRELQLNFRKPPGHRCPLCQYRYIDIGI